MWEGSLSNGIKMLTPTNHLSHLFEVTKQNWSFCYLKLNTALTGWIPVCSICATIISLLLNLKSWPA